MQLKSLLIVALAATCSLSMAAQKSKRSKKGVKAQKAAVMTPAKSTLQPVEGKTFSYALGVAQGKSLKQYLTTRMNVDTAYIGEAMRGMTTPVSEADRKKAIAFAAGLQLADVNTKNLPMMNKQACGREDSLYLTQKEFEQGLVDAVMQKSTITNDSAIKIVEQQFKYQQEAMKQVNHQWLELNKKQKGVKTLPSGLQYRILTEGKGLIASDSTEVEVNYEGKLIDGTVFDSSYKRNQPATFRPNQVIKGWKEALTMMPEGSKWELFIPAELGYGERGSGQQIPGNSTLIFTVEVLKVKK